MSQQCSHEGCNEEIFENGKCIFHCEKDTWYTETKDEKGEIVKDWSKEMNPNGKVTKFWEKIREKIGREKNDPNCKEHDFSHFIFPEFKDYKGENLETSHREEKIIENIKQEITIYKTKKDFNFWAANLDIVFKKNVIFKDAIFLGEVTFKYSKFTKDANFEFAKFLEKVTYFGVNFMEYTSFDAAEFYNDTDFSLSKFLEETNFQYITFSRNADFEYAIFFNKISFFDTIFSQKVSFKDVEFLKKVNFNYTTIKEEISFENTIFIEEASFNNADFLENTKFLETKFSNEKQTTFEATEFNTSKTKNNKKIPASVYFSNILFPDKVIFRSCDLSRASFLNSNIEKVRFDECEWGKLETKITKTKDKEKKVEICHNKYRSNKLWDEYSADKDKDDATKFRQIENIYRQLKKNFDDKKDNQTADDFYVGEMEMRKIALEKEGRFKNFGRLIFLYFYRCISYYNSRPFQASIWLIAIIIVFPFIFWLQYDFLIASQISFAGAIPLIKSPIEIKGAFWWIYSIETIISSIVWALLILSIRQKFKR